MRYIKYVKDKTKKNKIKKEPRPRSESIIVKQYSSRIPSELGIHHKAIKFD